MAGFVAVFAMSLPVLLAAFADHVYDAGAGGYGLLNAMVALGALDRSGRFHPPAAIAAALGGGVRRVVRPDALPGLVGMPSMVWFSATMVLAGFWCLMFLTAANQMVQTSSNLSIRGRVMSLYLVVLIGGQAIGGPMMGWLAEHVGPHVALFVAGGVPAIAAAVVAVVLARKSSLHLEVDLRDRRRVLRIVERRQAA